MAEDYIMIDKFNLSSHSGNPIIQGYYSAEVGENREEEMKKGEKLGELPDERSYI